VREQSDRSDEHGWQSDKHRVTCAITGSHAVTGADTGASSRAITGTWSGAPTASSGSGARTACPGSGARPVSATGARLDVRWLDQSGALVR